MITIDKYGQSVKVYDGITYMFYKGDPLKRGTRIVKSTGMVSILQDVYAHFTEFVINGAPITTIEEFTTQYALAMPVDGGSGGGERFGIEDTTGVQDRTVDMQGFILEVVNSNYARLATGDDNAVSSELLASAGYANIKSQTTANEWAQVSTSGSQFDLISNKSDVDQLAITSPSDISGLKNVFLPVSVLGNNADAAGNITLGGASGSFTSLDGKTITVTDGIITDITGP